MSRANRPMYVVGDVHGDASRLLFLLRNHGLVAVGDNQVHWTKRDVILLFMGDVLDALSRRGEFANMAFQDTPSDLWILELIRTLHARAADMGNTVMCLLGNHELMNLKCDFSYVSPYHMKSPSVRRAYFGPGGKGRELVQELFHTTVSYNGNLYAHAGVPTEPTEFQRTLVGKRVRGRFMDLLDNPDVEHFVSHREYLEAATRERCFAVGRMCRRHSAKRMVIGHNYLGGAGVVSRFDGRVVFADVGLSRAFTTGDRAEALEIVYDPGDGELRVLGVDGALRDIPRAEDEVAAAPPSSSRAGDD